MLSGSGESRIFDIIYGRPLNVWKINGGAILHNIGGIQVNFGRSRKQRLHMTGPGEIKNNTALFNFCSIFIMNFYLCILQLAKVK